MAGQKMRTKVCIALLVLFSQTVTAASFNCGKASSFAEKAVCSDALLGRLDEALARNYAGMLSADLGSSKAALRKEQSRWLLKRDKCTSRPCLVNVYRDRLDETCEYGVVSGIHPECTMSTDIR
ncbi:MAG: lysozyme inhibitor LprI family protein [Rhodocyclaceae bacterium]